MKTRASQHSYLPLLVTGIAVVLFSTAGIVRMMGWTQSSAGDSGSISRLAPVLASGEERTRAKCAECGMIMSMREIETHEEDPGPGTAGEVMGGNRDGSRVKAVRSGELIVRMADGSSRVIETENLARWRTGERLIVIVDAGPSDR